MRRKTTGTLGTVLGLAVAAASLSAAQSVTVIDQCGSQQQIREDPVSFYLFDGRKEKNHDHRTAKVCVTSSGGFARMDIWDADGRFIPGPKGNGIPLKSADTEDIEASTCWKGTVTAVQLLGADTDDDQDDDTLEVCVRLLLRAPPAADAPGGP